MLQMASKAPIATKSQHVTNGLQMGSKLNPNGIQMGSKWDPNGFQMGSKWDPNGIQMQQKVTYSRSYLVVTSICYKWLEKNQFCTFDIQTK